MKSLFLIFISVCYLLSVIQSAAVEPKVAELLKDDKDDNSTTEKELPTNEDCIQPKETGRCFALFYRFAYDVENGACVEFIYGGCAGNSNNFMTKEDCEAQCMNNRPNSSEAETTVATDSETATTTELAASA